jgi:hypothetical protein
MHVREVAALVPTAKGLDPRDRTLAGAAVKRARDVMLLHERKGIVRRVGLQRVRSTCWGLVEG